MVEHPFELLFFAFAFVAAFMILRGTNRPSTKPAERAVSDDTWVARRTMDPHVAAQVARHLAEVPPRKPEGFGFKCEWIAVRDRSTDEVVHALGLVDVEPIGWAVGVHQAYEGRVFVSPPIDGWVLAVSGAGLLDRVNPPDDEASAYLLAEKLARELGTDVCSFASHRVGDCFSWSRSGSTTRSLLHADGATIVRGAITDVERALGVPLDESSIEDEFFVDESTVIAVAAAWSIDPTTLSSREATTELGRIGS